MSLPKLDARLCFLATVLVLASSCQRGPGDFHEVKRIHEKVTKAELEQFFRIIDALPDKKLPELPPVLRPLPNWNPERTLPVSELANEEKKALESAWKVDSLTRVLKRNKDLQRALQSEQMTLKQFIGLTLAIGAACSRSQLRANQNLNDVIARGREVLDETPQIQKDDRNFAQLSREARFTVLRRAGWLTRIDRANRLKDVPPENIALVRAHAKQLDKILPKQFLENPLDTVADLLEERGMPFEELDSSGRDDKISWGPEDNPIIGTDKPDVVANRPNSAIGRSPVSTGKTTSPPTP